MLEAEEHAAGGAAVGAELGDVLALEPDAPARDLVAGVGEEGLGQRGLAGAVRPHERVDFALADGQGHAAEDLGVGDPDVEILEFEKGGGRAGVTGTSVITTIPVVEMGI